jgi:hypothetical protein
MPISKRKKQEIKTCYCRKCQKDKKETEFFSATDEFLDSNKKLSICKDCCNEIYNSMLKSEGSMSKAILRCCRILNMKFDEDAVDATKIHLETMRKNETESDKVIGIYRGKLATVCKKNFKDKNAIIDLTFQEDVGLRLSADDPIEDHEDEKTAEELKLFWDGVQSYDDIAYLQNEFNKLGGATLKDDRPKAILLREICFQMLDIKQNRGNPGVDRKVQALAKLMGDSAIRPDQKKVADGNKSSEAFGLWLADIEKYKPSEWWRDQNIYKDVNDIKGYWDTHVLRPFLNFWGVQKNMNFPGAVERNDFLDDNPDIRDE